MSGCRRAILALGVPVKSLFHFGDRNLAQEKPSIFKICILPAASPATIVWPSNETVQESVGLSAVSKASSFPLSRSQTHRQRAVIGRRDRTATIWRDGDPVYRIAVAFERAEALAALQVPNPERVVPRRRDRAATVRRDGDPVYRIAVAFERAEALAALQVANPQRVVLGRRDRTATVRRDGDLVHRTAVAFELADCLASV
jgi:hypothetical protein